MGEGFKTRFCVGSRAACVILLWHFAVLLGYRMVYNIDIYMQLGYAGSFYQYVIAVVLSVIAIFSPIVGLLADIKFSRHRAVLCSSYIILLEVVIVIITAVVIQLLSKHHGVGDVILLLLLGAMVVSFIVFLINGFQFGMDQLHNSRTEDLILFIHWYVWVYYVSTLVTEVGWNLALYDARYFHYTDTIRVSGICVILLVLVTIWLLIIASLCTVRHRKVWFLLEPPSLNPYKLVYRVIKFAYQHKVPLNRSAFTFCEDELPSRLDLGKQKYGGPFTTREVEDVKAFLGILKVLVSVSPAFLLQTVSQATLPGFAQHSNVFKVLFHNETKHQVHIEGIARHIIISNGLLSPLLVAICLPLYLCLIRPRILYHIPGMLKRIGAGIVLMTLSLLCTLVMDIVVHTKETKFAHCMFATDNHHISRHIFNATNYPEPPLFQSIYFLTPQYILSSLVNMLIDIAVLEFICSQSPYSMKGLVFSLVISLRSLFSALAIVSMLPFGAPWKTSYALSCGSGFYLMYVIIAVMTLCLFSCVARRYKYRVMNEPCNEYRYAEEYYSNIQ